FPVFGAGLPAVYQGDFLDGKTAVFAVFLLVFARFRRCKGRYAPTEWVIYLFIGILYPIFGK
ncbi:MAG: hypothetical protein ACOX7A_04480, partial [Lawsonibacter sp.]